MTKGAIAAGHPETVTAARDVLESGGNAFDAALAAMAMACVAEPVLASPGGGGFLLARQASKPNQPVLYDFFSQTPRIRKPAEKVEFYPILADFGTATQEFHIGAGSIATPGMVPGMFAIHNDLCLMPIGDILQPAITCAKSGVMVNKFQSYLFGVVEAIFKRESASLACFGSPQGGLAKEGDIIKNPDMADMFDALSREGEALFREGDVAREICALCDDHGSHMNSDDLRLYQVERREPLISEYRDCKIITNPGPSTGGVLIGFALALQERIRLCDNVYGSRDYYKTLAQVMDATNRARLESGLDAGLEDSGLQSMLDEKFLAHYADYILGRPAALKGTTHISIVDGHGNTAALTLSNGEGCSHMVSGAGFMLNNMLGEEDINPLGFNEWPQNVRLCSMMAPTIMEHGDGKVTVLGSGGSNRIRTALLQVILNLIDHGLELQEAIEAPRIHYENSMLNSECLADSMIIGALQNDFEGALDWKNKNMFFGGVHAVSILQNDGCSAEYQAVGDLRRDGAICYC